jgi:phage terminase large subunit-like protein
MDLANVASALDGWERAEDERPLATAVLWHRSGVDTSGAKPRRRTSQRRALQNLGSLVTVLLGGNRTGKTEGGALWDVAQALGRDHPDAAAFIRNNGLNPDDFPSGPGLVVVANLTHKDSREYMRPKLQRYCPKGTTFKNWAADDEAQAVLPNGGRILCKAYKQGREAFQGFNARAFHGDEEGPIDVLLEAMRGLIDQGGKVLLTMTPLKGWTRLLERYVREPREDTVVHWLHGVDNPHIPMDALKRVLSQYGAHEREARAFGRITALEGRIYEFDRDAHVCRPFVPPPGWERIRVWDFGTRNPTCVLWMVRDPRDDTLYIYREHYQAEWRLSQHADEVVRLSRGENYITTVCDPEDLNARQTLANEHGIPNEPARKNVRSNINKVSEYLALDAEGKPHLKVFNSCKNTIREFESYIWQESRSKADDPEKPQKRDDHAMDCVAYGCRWWSDNSGGWSLEVLAG